MAMSILQIRVDDNLKNEVSDLFERLGMDILSYTEKSCHCTKRQVQCKWRQNRS